MFKNLWPFGKKKRVSDAAADNPTVPAVDPLDPLQRIEKLKGWNPPKEERKEIVLRSHEEFIAKDDAKSAAMDSDEYGASPSAKAASGGQSPYTVPTMIQDWYNSQGFIGYQACAIIAQNWLVDKACSMSGEDACRNGWELKTDGTSLDDDKTNRILEIDRDFKVKDNLVEFNRFRNVFGIRVALFEVESDDDKYYEKPFNIDGVERGSYKGISQVDPYWMTPQLDSASTANPAARDFYEPDFWIISGKKYHRSHLIIIRGPQPADILKPTYIFGGIPLTQRIYERVYAAERTANEAPLLAMSKRTTAIHVDMEKAVANEETFLQKLAFWVKFRDNHAVKVLGKEEAIEQFDTNLSDFDSIIMNQFQLVAAIAKTPSTKLLGTSPKGFNATGEFESVSYHEELESIQEHSFDPLLARHYELVAKSEGWDIHLKVIWNPVDSATAAAQAELNLKKAQTDETYANLGAISPDEVRQRLRDDPKSGFNRLSDDQVETEAGMTPENLAELEKAGAQQEKAEGEAARAEAQAGAVEGVSPPVPATPTGKSAQGVTAPGETKDAEDDPRKAELLKRLLGHLDDLRDLQIPEAQDIANHAANGTRASVAGSVSGMTPTVAPGAAIVGQKDHADLQRIRLKGLTALIENPRGSIRRGKSGNWQIKMPHHYGFIKGSTGADGDEIDCFIGPNLKAHRVFVVNQVKQDGTFDEHKCMLGFNSASEAKKAYMDSYSKGWTGFGTMFEMDHNAFRRWVQNGNTKVPLGKL